MEKGVLSLLLDIRSNYHPWRRYVEYQLAVQYELKLIGCKDYLENKQNEQYLK